MDRLRWRLDDQYVAPPVPRDAAPGIDCDFGTDLDPDDLATWADRVLKVREAPPGPHPKSSTRAPGLRLSRATALARSGLDEGEIEVWERPDQPNEETEIRRRRCAGRHADLYVSAIGV